MNLNLDLIKRKKHQSKMDLVQRTAGSNDHPERMIILDVLLAVALSVGCWYTFFSMFPNPVNDIISILLIVVMPAGLYLLYRKPLFGRFMTFYIFVITAVLFVIAYHHVWNGFLVMANIVVEVVNEQLGLGWIPFAITGGVADWSKDTMLAMIPVMLLESTAIAYSVRYKEPLLGFIMTCIPVMIGMCLKVSPSVVLLLVLLLSWTGLMILSAVAKPASRKKQKPIYIQSDKHSTLPYIFLGFTLVVMVGYILIFSGDDYKPPQSVDEAKRTVIAAEEHLRYDNLRGAETDGLSRGNLNDTHPLEYTDDIVLALTMDKVQPMYLRGFTGGNFEDGIWTEAPERAYSGEYTGAMEWLAQQYFYPWMQHDSMYRMSKNYDYFNVTAENLNTSSKYMYLPYEAALSDDTMPTKVEYKRDHGAYMKGLRGDRYYEFKVFETRINDYNEAGIAAWIREVKKSDDWDQYANSEAVYRRFVYDTYLNITGEDYKTLTEIGAKKVLGKTIEYTLKHIRTTFEEDFEYDIEQKAAPKGKSELQHFVGKSHTGNDMHFATVATLMFRSAGIPARYVEGYYISQNDADAYAQMSGVTVHIPDSYAHSWVEIYIDELGWFPVEVIPGYYNLETVKTEEVQEEQKTEEENRVFYQDEVRENDKWSKKGEGLRIDPIWFVFLFIILLIAAFEYFGRKRSRERRSTWGVEFSDEKVFEMYRYVCLMMIIDKNFVPVNPYDKLEEIGSIYDGATETSFEEILRLVNRARFGKIRLNEEEHKKMATYAENIGSHVFEKQNKIKQFIMKFIIFCV